MIVFLATTIISFQNCSIVSPAQSLKDLSGSSALSSYSTVPTFSEISQKVFTPKCISCHNAGSGLTDFSSYAAIMASGVIVVGNSASSILYKRIIPGGGMPKGTAGLSTVDLAAVASWIDSGASSSAATPGPAPGPAPVPAPVPVPQTFPPANPNGLLATTATQSQINLTWNDNSTDETGFKIERGLSVSGPFAVIATTAANIKNYSDVTGLSPSTAYYYRLAAVNSAGSSAYTSTVSATTSAAVVGLPAQPASASAVAISGTAVNVTWVDSSNNETGFKVERAISAAGPFSIIANVGGGVVNFSDTGLSAVTTYYYRVSSVNMAGSSAVTVAPAVTTFGTFAWVFSNISSPKCLKCHSGTSPSAGYDMSTYSGTLLKVVKNNSASSLFYSTTNNGSMPLGGVPLTAVQLNALKTWIDSGALNN